MRHGENVDMLHWLTRIALVLALIAIAASLATEFDPFGWTW
jgi:hypothetical protein